VVFDYNREQTLNNTKMTSKSKKAIKRWGLDLAIKFLHLNEVIGNGARSIGQDHGLTTRQADSLIEAGRELWRLNQTK
jgi:hypothetical protein